MAEKLDINLFNDLYQNISKCLSSCPFNDILRVFHNNGWYPISLISNIELSILDVITYLPTNCIIRYFHSYVLAGVIYFIITWSQTFLIIYSTTPNIILLQIIEYKISSFFFIPYRNSIFSMLPINDTK